MQLPLLAGKKRISLETIDFQSDSFGADLELIVTEIQKKVIEKVYKDILDIEISKEVRDFTNIIAERFGLKVKVVCDGPLAAILPFYTNKNHIFLDKLVRGNIEIKSHNKLLKQADNRKGIVNRHKATVGGFFSECENILYLNFTKLFLVNKYSVPEVVAVTLHELGHAFAAFEYSDRLETSNQVLQSISKELNSNKEKSDQVYIYRELKVINPKVTEEEIDKLITGNRIVASAIWFKVIIGTVEEQLRNSVYSKTSAEQIADSFCSRFHYGRNLITALDKDENYWGNVEKNKNAAILYALLETIGFGIFLASAFITLPLSLMISLMSGAVAFCWLRMLGEDFKDYTYDELKIRYKRMRNESVEYLKNMDLPADKVRPILDDIYSMDKIITETYRYSTPLNVIANFVFTGAREARASVVEQQMLEELATNDIFVAAADLRTIHS